MADALGFDEEPLARADFDFDDEALHSYYELHLRPHDRGAGWRRFWISALGLLPMTALSYVALQGVAEALVGRLPPSPDALALPLEISVFFLAWEIPLIGILIYSIVLMRGRHPDWGSREWQAKSDAMFRHLASGDTANPIDPSVEKTSFLLDSSFLCAKGLLTLGDSWYDTRVSFRHLSWRFVRDRAERPTASHNVPFSARFYADRIEKGSHGAVFARSYRDVFDVVEDKRYPDWAIVRSSDRVSHLVVKKSALLGASWDEVKARIKDAKGEVTLREALFGDKKSRKKG